MAIEAVNSAMTLQQVQSAPKVQESSKAETNTSESGAKSQPVTVDVNTQVVEKSTNKEFNNNSNNNGNLNQEAQQANNEKIKKAVEQLNKNMSHSEAVFGIHDKTNRLTIKIIDRETKEIIKELPPEKTLDMIAKVWELAGILVDERR